MSSDISGSSILFYAVLHRSSSVVKYFIDECGANSNGFGIEQLEKITCQSKAVSLNHRDMLEILRRSADINAVSDRDKTSSCFISSMESDRMS